MLTLKAYAKINLCLDIAGIRPDGYHNIDTVMQSISLFDTVCIDVGCEGVSVICKGDETLNGENNIAYKAVEKFYVNLGRAPKARVEIEKNIPLAAGLGGGSADAAAVLVGLNILNGSPFDDNKLREIALTLGADVPFCISGGTARAQGVGEILESVSPMPDCSIKLVSAGKKPSTKEMYKAVDEAENPLRVNTGEMVKALKSGDLAAVCSSLGNSFEIVWENNREVKKNLASEGALAASLSGSGPTVFGIFPPEFSPIKPVNRGLEIISE